MKTHCEKCGSAFTKQEIKKLLEEAEICEPIFICQDCHEQQGNFEQGEHDYYSDADNGL